MPTQEGKARIIVGMGTCGLAAGARDLYTFLRREVARRRLDAEVKPVGCIGMCENEVLVDVQLPGESRVTYGNMDVERARRVLEELLEGGRAVEEWVVGIIDDEAHPYRDLPFYRKQERFVLARSGFIDPNSIDDYLSREGYRALKRVLEEMGPEEVVEVIKTSGLRGRGGAGFPTGTKWELCRKAPGHPKYIICNADEGDPGAFMDRTILEGDPHAVLEGMVIGAYAIGASMGYIYIRAEYPLAIERLEKAIVAARRRGFLGDDILGSGLSFDVRIKKGAGAFVCGEETALMSSIEGGRGMPRPRPPYPAERGLWGKPTNINNVETWANVPLIIRRGAEWYRRVGTAGSTGTKVFAMTGKVANTGLVEVPMGITLREIIYDIGGGIKGDVPFKAVQIGGPSGGCLPEEMLDTPIDYDSLTEAGAMMGSGGMVVMDETSCMVDIARFFTRFNHNESCAKCTPCREGTLRMMEILDRIVAGEGTREDLDRLEELGEVLQKTSLCGLGQTAPNPVLSTLRYFREEYLEHVEGHCRAGVCEGLSGGRAQKEVRGG